MSRRSNYHDNAVAEESFFSYLKRERIKIYRNAGKARSDILITSKCFYNSKSAWFYGTDVTDRI